MGEKLINVRVRRYDPTVDDEGYFQSYEVSVEEGATVLSVLRGIYEELDHSLAFYSSCRIGKCAGCHVKVNGRTKLACTALVDGDLTLEPQARFTVIRDLVVDRTVGAVVVDPV